MLYSALECNFKVWFRKVDGILGKMESSSSLYYLFWNIVENQQKKKLFKHVFLNISI